MTAKKKAETGRPGRPKRKRLRSRIVPRGAWVLVLPEGKKTRTDNGLLLPAGQEADRKAVGEVVAVGPDAEDIESGDSVVYGAYAGEQVAADEHGGREYRLLMDEDIIAFVR